MDPILLQKQIRDNSEDLNKYLSELKSWEEDMKRKEKNLYGDTEEHEETEGVPPVRSKIKKISEPITPLIDEPMTSNIKQDDVKQPRIPSDNYSAWDNFDVEKACEEFEKETMGIQSEKEVEKQKNAEEALYEKENGNKLVRLGKWKEAMECYTRAIIHDSNNAIFYANRAQCALKLQKWQEVIDDCCKALKIEPGYVKAYLRRSTACVKTEDYQGAIDDLNKAIQLEPGNKEARNSLAEAKVQLQKAKATKKQADNSMIVAISKPLHLRSKVPLKSIPIEEVGSSSKVAPKKIPEKGTKPSISIMPDPIVETIKPKPEKLVSVPSPKKMKQLPVATKRESVFVEKIPPPPKTSVQFMLAWSQLRPQQQYSYLEQIPGAQLPHLFGNSLESKVLSEVLTALKTAPSKSRVFEYLEGLSKAQRFSAITLFMTSEDKSNVNKLLETCKSTSQCTEDQVQVLKQKYEV